ARRLGADHRQLHRLLHHHRKHPAAEWRSADARRAMAVPAADARAAVRPARAETAAACGPGEDCGLKLGILGGTFDPIHNAHLAIAKTALQSLGLAKILWIPTGKPGYRKPPVASAFDRLAMLALAIKDEADFEIDSRELASSASPYTVDTLTT